MIPLVYFSVFVTCQVLFISLEYNKSILVDEQSSKSNLGRRDRTRATPSIISALERGVEKLKDRIPLLAKGYGL
jgi:hypothetical protein